jgi:O-antigen biosynthesis protein WbqP
MSVAGNAIQAIQPQTPGYLPVKRLFDIVTALIGLVVLAPPMLVIAMMVRAQSAGPAIHWSRRAGRNGVPFSMPKFRSMRMDAPVLATRDMADAESWVTPIGRLLRRTSLDEVPQLWSVLIGKMSIIGPRAVLLEETDLLAARHSAGVLALRPGITGWAQVNGRDNLSLAEKVALDADYIRHCSISFDLMIAIKTIKRVLLGADVWH